MFNSDRDSGCEGIYFCASFTPFVSGLHIFVNVEMPLESNVFPLLKCTTAMRMLAYGTPADLLDEGLRIAECTVIEC